MFEMEEPTRVVAQMMAKAGKEEQVKLVLLGLVRQTRQEPGCLHYELLQSHSDPLNFVLIEEWKTQLDLDSHTAAPHTKTARAEVEPWLGAVPPDVRLYRTIA